MARRSPRSRSAREGTGDEEPAEKGRPRSIRWGRRTGLRTASSPRPERSHTSGVHGGGAAERAGEWVRGRCLGALQRRSSRRAYLRWRRATCGGVGSRSPHGAAKGLSAGSGSCLEVVEPAPAMRPSFSAGREGRLVVSASAAGGVHEETALGASWLQRRGGRWLAAGVSSRGQPGGGERGHDVGPPRRSASSVGRPGWRAASAIASVRARGEPNEDLHAEAPPAPVGRGEARDGAKAREGRASSARTPRRHAPRRSGSPRLPARWSASLIRKAFCEGASIIAIGVLPASERAWSLGREDDGDPSRPAVGTSISLVPMPVGLAITRRTSQRRGDALQAGVAG